MAARLSNPAVRAGILALVAIAIVLSLAVPLRSFVRQDDENAALAADVAATQQQIDDIKGRIEAWQDKSYVEQQARERLDYSYLGRRRTSWSMATARSATRLPKPNQEELSSRSWYERFWNSVDNARG